MFLASFTSQERFVLLFLSVSLIVGALVRLTQLEWTPALQIDTPRMQTEMSAFESASHQLNHPGSPGLAEKPTATPTLQASFLININSATSSELQQLPGIGPALANRIVAYRTDNGPFTETEDLKLVKGIGTKLFSKISTTISTD